MAFKIKNPLHFDGTVNPGKKLETPKTLTKKDSPDFAQSGVGSKIITNQQYRDSGRVPKGMESTFSGKGTLRVSKDFEKSRSSEGGSRKVSSSTTGAYGAGGTAESLLKGGSGKKVTKTKPKVDPNKNRKPRKKVTAIDKVKSNDVKRGDYGKGVKNKKGVAKGLDVKAPEISTKKPTVKAAPKDNSRKDIRQRKKADKAAGVSKSQMRANKAKSKSEAFMAKAKASKDPSMRAQLKRKSDRLAKRAARKGGSPAKAVNGPGDPKDPKKKYGKVTVKKEKKDNTTTVTATRPYSISKGGKNLGPDFKPTKAQKDKANKDRRETGSDTKSITVVDKKQIRPKKLSTTPKPKISSAKPSIKPSSPREKAKITQTLKKQEFLDSREEKQKSFDEARPNRKPIGTNKSRKDDAKKQKKINRKQKKKKPSFNKNLRSRVSVKKSESCKTKKCK